MSGENQSLQTSTQNSTKNSIPKSDDPSTPSKRRKVQVVELTEEEEQIRRVEQRKVPEARKNCIIRRKLPLKGNIRGSDPRAFKYNSLVVRKEKGESFVLKDKDTGELILQVWYDVMTEKQRSLFWVMSQRLDDIYRGGKRGSASGYSDNRKMLTFGYTRVYTGVREEDKPVFPTVNILDTNPVFLKPTTPNDTEKQVYPSKVVRQFPSIPLIVPKTWDAVNKTASLFWDQLHERLPGLVYELELLSAPLTEKGLRLGTEQETGFSALTFNIDCTVRMHIDISDNPKSYSYTSVLWEEDSHPLPPNPKEDGLLVLPQYNIAIQLGHGDCYLLKARNTYHGVTSSKKKRISIVAFQHEKIFPKEKTTESQASSSEIANNNTDSIVNHEQLEPSYNMSENVQFLPLEYPPENTPNNFHERWLRQYQPPPSPNIQYPLTEPITLYPPIQNRSFQQYTDGEQMLGANFEEYLVGAPLDQN